MELTIKTTQKSELIDITQKVKNFVKESKTKDGVCLIYTKHTTTSIIINEKEDRLLGDIKEFLEKLAPVDKKYKHDEIEKRDCPPNEPENGHAHLKSILLGSSKIIPVKNEELQLGQWQNIFFCEFDGPRERTIILKILD